MPRAALPFLLALAAACASRAPVVEGPVRYREPIVDILHYDIAVELDHEAGLVDGTVHVRFAGLPRTWTDEILLHAADMTIEGVWDERGDALDWCHDGTELTIGLPGELGPGEEALVTVDYHCYPALGLFFVGPTETDPERPWHVWSQGQMEDTRRWVPVWDIPNDRATHELTVTCDDDFVTMAAGERVDSRVNERRGTRTDRWSMPVPHASYLITLVAGGYEVGELDGPLPLPVLAEARDMDFALANFENTGDMVAYFGELLDHPYPYAKYAQSCVRDYTAGGMENISATTLFYGTIHDPADEPQVDSTGLLAHEVAHQWFGDLLTCRTWHHTWLNEGFASYYEALYTRHLRGEDAFRYEMLRNQRGYVGSQRRNGKPIVWPRLRDPERTFDGHAYAGGASVLHRLRDELGAEAFDRGIAHYVDAHAPGLVTTDDLRAALEASTGRDLSRFFEQWLHQPAVPHLRVAVEDGSTLRVEQFQDEVFHVSDGVLAVFALDVAVAWSRGGVERRGRMAIDERVERFPLDGDGDLDWVRFDADTTVPMVLEFDQERAAWRRQLLDAADGVTRLLAAEALGRGRDLDDEDVAALVAAARDPFDRVAAEALSALDGEDGDKHVRTAVLDGLRSGSPRVRAAAARALAGIGGEEVLPDLMDALDDQNASVVAAALDALVEREHPGALGRVLAVYDGTDKMRLQASCVRLAADVDDEEEVLPFLMRAARWNRHRRVRSAAVSELGRFDGEDDAVLRQLAASLADPSYSVRRSAAWALGGRGDRRATPHLRAAEVTDSHPQVRRAARGALDALHGG